MRAYCATQSDGCGLAITSDGEWHKFTFSVQAKGSDPKARLVISLDRSNASIWLDCISIFPHEIFRCSRRWAESRFTDLRHFRELDRGGHFAAFEQPELFVTEVRDAFRSVR